MRHRIELFRKLARMTFELLFVILLTIFFENVLLKHEPGVINRVVLSVLYLASLVVKNASRMRVVALGWHIAFGFIIYKLPIDMVSRVMLLVITFYLMCSAMEYIGQGRRLKPIDDAPWPSFFIMLILYLFGIYTKSHTFVNSTYVVALLMLVTYYIMTYLEGLKAYIDSTKDVQGLPLGKVIARNNIIVFGITVFLALCMIVGCMLDYSVLISWIKEIVRAILKLITSVFMIMSIILNRLVSTNPSGAFSFTSEESVAIEKYGNNVGDSFMIILYVAIGLFALIVLTRLLKFVLKLLFAKNKSQDDIVEVAESRNDISEEKKKKSRFARLSDEEKFRRKYKNYIEGYRYDIRLSDNTTCREIEKDIREQELGDVSEITEIYASVRYGEVKADKNLLRRVKGLLRK